MSLLPVHAEMRDGEDLLGGAMIWNDGEKLYSAGRVGRGSKPDVRVVTIQKNRKRFSN